jgi:hypothetical protein
MPSLRQVYSILPGKARELAGRKIGVDELMSEIRKDIVFYDDSGAA